MCVGVLHCLLQHQHFNWRCHHQLSSKMGKKILYSCRCYHSIPMKCFPEVTVKWPWQSLQCSLGTNIIREIWQWLDFNRIRYDGADRPLADSQNTVARVCLLVAPSKPPKYICRRTHWQPTAKYVQYMTPFWTEFLSCWMLPRNSRAPLS